MRFDSYHPAINALFFAAVITAAVNFDHPVFLLLGWFCAFVFSVALEGRRALLIDMLLLPLAGIFAVFYASYHHFGVTELAENFIGNRITVESFVYGAVLGIKAVTVVMWFLSVRSVVSSDKVIYLLGRVWPRLSLILAILLRTLPRIRVRCRKVEEARHCIGYGIRQGNVLSRLRNLFREISTVITWTLDDFIDTSNSMGSRGYALRGRTAFSIYRFDNRDRLFVIALFFGFTVMGAGIVLDQTRTTYAPEIRINPVSRMSFLFYAVYCLTGLLPVILQIIGERRFQRMIRQSYGEEKIS